MPELPEVKTVCKYLKLKILNKNILSMFLLENKSLHDFAAEEFNKINNQIVVDVSQIAKFIVIKSQDYYFIIHLRMEGKFTITKDYKVINNKIFVWHFEDFDLVLSDHRKFATINIYNAGIDLRTQAVFKNIGSEPKEINIDKLFDLLKEKRIPIKTILLDQKYLAGVGNIYADEILYFSKIHPLRLMNSISYDEFKIIVKNAIKILDEATILGGSTIKTFSAVGNEGNYQYKLIVHQNFNNICKNCGATIEKIKVNGRGTYFCPEEQK